MSTFQELHAKLQSAMHQKNILEYLINHLSSNFMATNGSTPKQYLLTDDGIKLPNTSFEAMHDTLLDVLKEIQDTISEIQEAELATRSDEDGPGRLIDSE